MVYHQIRICNICTFTPYYSVFSLSPFFPQVFKTLLVNFWSKLYSKSLKPQIPKRCTFDCTIESSYIISTKGGPKLGHPLRTVKWYHPSHPPACGTINKVPYLSVQCIALRNSFDTPSLCSVAFDAPSLLLSRFPFNGSIKLENVPVPPCYQITSSY